MANYCYTEITISGEEDEIRLLNDEMEKAFEEGKNQGGRSDQWLGYLMLHIGYSVDNLPVSCRGSVCYHELSEDGTSLFIETETDWSPMLQVFLLFIQKYAPEAELIYTAEEPGCDLFCTNDPAHEEYMLMLYVDDDELPEALQGFDGTDNCIYAKDLKEILFQLYPEEKDLQTKEDKTKELIKRFNSKQYGIAWIYEYQYVPASECA